MKKESAGSMGLQTKSYTQKEVTASSQEGIINPVKQLLIEPAT